MLALQGQWSLGCAGGQLPNRVVRDCARSFTRDLTVHTIRLVYASDALAGLNYRDFVAIMERAGERNRELAITGMLCYGGGQFLQALEGERDAVNALYHRIVTDGRHTNYRLLSVEEIETRAFPEWSMKIVDWSTTVSAPRQAILLRHTGSSVFDPRNMSAAHALAFLNDLAAAERLLLE